MGIKLTSKSGKGHILVNLTLFKYVEKYVENFHYSKKLKLYIQNHRKLTFHNSKTRNSRLVQITPN